MLREDGDLEPPLGPFEWYIDAFRELSTCRSSMAVAPIPFTAIAEYCNIYDVEDGEEFHYLIRVLDRTYVKLHQKDGESGSSIESKTD